jgi:SAM-dependent methyltransferase
VATPASSSLRKILPEPLRRFLRILVDEFPHRLRDFRADLRDTVTRESGPPLPPARLRRRVSRSSSRSEFEDVGRICATEILAAFRAAAERPEDFPRWLDFGCGAGRIARHLSRSEFIKELSGVDVDREAIRWAAKNLSPSIFKSIPALPPTSLPSDRFDVVVCVSIFTHLDEPMQLAWLKELARILRPGGLLIASTHSPRIAPSLAGVRPEQLAALSENGFLFLPGRGAFNENATFHSKEYLIARWTNEFLPRSFTEFGLAGYQDLGVWARGTGRSEPVSSYLGTPKP